MFTKLHEPILGINNERRQKSVLGRHSMVKYVLHRSTDVILEKKGVITKQEVIEELRKLKNEYQKDVN